MTPPGLELHQAESHRFCGARYRGTGALWRALAATQ